MKKSLLLILAMVALIAATNAQQTSYPSAVALQTPRTITTGGAFNRQLTAHDTGNLNYTTVPGTVFTLKTTLDTIANTGTDTFKQRIPTYVNVIGFEFIETVISGSPSGGSLVAYGSMDNGVNWVQIGSPNTLGSGSKVYTLTGSSVPFLQHTNVCFVLTGAGTCSVSWKGIMIMK